MEKLIIVRHGEYDETDHLSAGGKISVALLANKLRDHISSPVIILSSIADRAKESAQILAKKLGVDYELHEVLWSESGHPEDFPIALELIQTYQDQAEVVILVTHYEYTRDFPAYFAEKVLGTKFEKSEIEKGEAIIIDLNENTLQKVGKSG